MLRDIDRETVDFAPNFDGRWMEPVVLPSRFPNLLANGSSGIAVGMATNIPPHNLRELWMRSCSRPQPGLHARRPAREDARPGLPDRRDDLRQRGNPLSLRDGPRSAHGARARRLRGNEARTADRRHRDPLHGEQVALLERIAELVREGRIDGVADLRDESNREGMRIVIELRRMRPARSSSTSSTR